MKFNDKADHFCLQIKLNAPKFMQVFPDIYYVRIKLWFTAKSDTKINVGL